MFFQTPWSEQNEAELPVRAGFGQKIPVLAGDIHKKGLAGPYGPDAAANIDTAGAGNGILKQAQGSIDPGQPVPMVACRGNLIVAQGEKLKQLRPVGCVPEPEADRLTRELHRKTPPSGKHKNFFYYNRMTAYGEGPDG
ncbi:hypothetical protein D3C71_1845550 [compost metagenome]